MCVCVSAPVISLPTCRLISPSVPVSWQGCAGPSEAGTRALRTLHALVLPFILRRLKTHVLHDLPPKVHPSIRHFTLRT